MTEVIQAGFWDSVGSCAKNMTIPLCTRLNLLVETAFTIFFNALSPPQQRVTKMMEKEIMGLANEGEKIQYVINGICAGLVIVCLIVIIPIFSWVIKDKSYVLAIFSDIEPEELHKVINDCKNLDIKNAKFKKKWLTKYQNRPESFWKKVFNNISETKNKKTSREFVNVKTTNCIIPPQNLAINSTEEQKNEKRVLLSEIEYFSGFKSCEKIAMN